MNKHIDEALAENHGFEEAIGADNDPFVNDVRNDDPLAFIVRGALHLESRLTELLLEIGTSIPQRSDFNTKIRLLESSGRFSQDGIEFLDQFRHLRNAVAHELDAGRSVPSHMVDALQACLTDERLKRITKICGRDPLALEPDLLTRLIMNNINTELEGTKRRLRWEADYERILPPEARTLTKL